MPIKIFLPVYDKYGVKNGDTEVLEDLEDSIRDLLRGKGFGEFTIENSYTGNELSPHGSEEEEEDIYECEHCNAEFRKSEILYLKRVGEIGTIAFCPRCKQATKLICVTEVGE